MARLVTGARQGIGGEGARLAAKHVARKLVEQNEQRQRTLGASFPCGQLAACRRFVGFEKAPANLVVEG
jgi:hypothetical protein